MITTLRDKIEVRRYTKATYNEALQCAIGRRNGLTATICSHFRFRLFLVNCFINSLLHVWLLWYTYRFTMFEGTVGVQWVYNIFWVLGIIYALVFFCIHLGNLANKTDIYDRWCAEIIAGVRDFGSYVFNPALVLLTPLFRRVIRKSKTLQDYIKGSFKDYEGHFSSKAKEYLHILGIAEHTDLPVIQDSSMNRVMVKFFYVKDTIQGLITEIDTKKGELLDGKQKLSRFDDDGSIGMVIKAIDDQFNALDQKKAELTSRLDTENENFTIVSEEYDNLRKAMAVARAFAVIEASNDLQAKIEVQIAKVDKVVSELALTSGSARREIQALL